MKKTIILILLLAVAATAHAQREVRTKSQTWYTYVLTGDFTDKWGMYGDVQYLDKSGNFTTHLGGVYKLSKTTRFTAGYAYAIHPAGDGLYKLERKENRLWTHLAFFVPLGSNFNLVQRTRFDFRFRQDTYNGTVLDDWTMYPRLRLRTTIRKHIPAWSFGEFTPYLIAQEELMMNLGRKSANAFDQNRFLVGAGLSVKGTQLQVGYMNRYTPVKGNVYLSADVLSLRITQHIDFRKSAN